MSSIWCKECARDPEQQPHNPYNDPSIVSIRRPEPYKLKLIKSLGLSDFVIDKLVIAKNPGTYSFSRKDLRFLQSSKVNIPLIYFPRLFPKHSTVLIYSHGNGSNLNSVYEFARRMSILYGIAVVAYDYTGYGQSKRKGLVDFESDIHSVLAWVVCVLGYQLQRVILAGFSLGTYPALLPRGLMPRLLIAPISGLLSFMEGQVAHYEGEPFDNIHLAKQLKKSRVFMLHSVKDSVSVNHSRILYQAFAADRESKDKQKVLYIETEQLSHERTSQFLALQENREFKKFLTQVAKEAEDNTATSRTQPECLELINRLKTLANQITVRQEEIKS